MKPMKTSTRSIPPPELIELHLDLYRQMLRLRVFEEEVAKLFLAGALPGFLHSYIGQEAVAVGVCSCLREDDYVLSTHRGHGHVLAKGARMDRMMAELFGKQTGYCKGKGGSMHIVDLGTGVIGANGIVGGNLPIATGVALSAKKHAAGQVAVAFFGDGATNQGTFHEALNLASIWDLPAVFVCENNLYAMGTAQRKHQRVERVAERAAAYRMPGVTVDGNNLLAVREAAREAVDRARAGQGPTLLECITYRKLGHYVGDPGKYRPPGEAEEWEAKDPIRRFREKAFSAGVSEELLQEVERRVREELAQAVRFAKASPLPPEEDALEDVFKPTEAGRRSL